MGLFGALFLLWDDDSQSGLPGRTTPPPRLRQAKPKVPKGAERSSWDVVSRRNHQQKVAGRPVFLLPLLLTSPQALPGVHRPPSVRAFDGGPPLLCPPSLWTFLKYNIVILGFLWPARGREVLPHWVDVQEAAGVPVICGPPPPGVTLRALGAVIQGEDGHSLGLIIYVVRS